MHIKIIPQLCMSEEDLQYLRPRYRITLHYSQANIGN